MQRHFHIYFKSSDNSTFNYQFGSGWHTTDRPRKNTYKHCSTVGKNKYILKRKFGTIHYVWPESRNISNLLNPDGTTALTGSPPTYSYRLIPPSVSMGSRLIHLPSSGS